MLYTYDNCKLKDQMSFKYCVNVNAIITKIRLLTTEIYAFINIKSFNNNVELISMLYVF